MGEFMAQLIVVLGLIGVALYSGKDDKKRTKYYEEKMYEHAAKGEREMADMYSRIVVARKRNKM